MPGRITDELRRITREQGGVVAPPVEAAPVRESWARKYGSFVAMVVAFVLAGLGWWVFTTMREMSRIQDCGMQGRKNCAPVSTEGTGP